MEILKYSLNNQNSPSLTWKKMRLPDPVAKTRNIGLLETGRNVSPSPFSMKFTIAPTFIPDINPTVIEEMRNA